MSACYLAFLQAAQSVSSSALGSGSSKSSSHVFAWLIQLGGVGVFLLAVVDSSVIPVSLPGSTDLVLLLLTAFRSSSIRSPITYASCAFVGSMIGGYMTWAAGKKGGEAALNKLGQGRFVHRVQDWVKRNGMFSVWLASILPPPVPLMPFLLVAGALGLSRARFSISYCTGRVLRYGVVAWLGFRYGRHVIELWQRYLRGWATPILSMYIALLVSGVVYGVWKYRKANRKQQ